VVSSEIYLEVLGRKKVQLAHLQVPFALFGNSIVDLEAMLA
jgi:hypothetical protein